MIEFMCSRYIFLQQCLTSHLDHIMLTVALSVVDIMCAFRFEMLMDGNIIIAIFAYNHLFLTHKVKV
jgi:hypothetical protein